MQSPPEPLRNDYQNARKRNLHAWMQWRTEVNRQLVDLILNPSQPIPSKSDMNSLKKIMDQNTTYKDDPTNNPKTLLTYAASQDNISELPNSKFIHYGIPRVKLNPVSTVRKSKESQGKKSNSLWDLNSRHAVEELQSNPGYRYSDSEYWQRVGSGQKLDADQLESVRAVTDVHLPASGLHSGYCTQSDVRFDRSRCSSRQKQTPDSKVPRIRFVHWQKERDLDIEF